MNREKANPAPGRVRDSVLTTSIEQEGAEVRSSLSRKSEKSMSTSRRINPDSIQTLWFTVGVVGFLAATSFMVSFAGLTEVAKWVGVPVWMRWTIPAFIDMAILAYSMAVLIHRSRGASTWRSWISLSLFTGVSVVANAAHALSIEHEVIWQAWIGAGLAALAPIGVFAATEELGRLAVEQPEPRIKSRKIKDLGEYQNSEAHDVESAVLSRRAVEQSETAVAPEPVIESTPAVEAAPVVAPIVVEEPEDEPDPEPDPQPEKPKEEAPVQDAAEGTPLFDQVAQETEPSRAIEPAPVAMAPIATAPKLTVVGNTAKAAPVAELDKLARFVSVEVTDGRTPSAKAIAELLEVSERTARRKLASLKETRPEIFSAAERKQA